MGCISTESVIFKEPVLFCLFFFFLFVFPHLKRTSYLSVNSCAVVFSVLNGALWDVEQVHSGICELGQLQAMWWPGSSQEQHFNTLRPRQNGRHFADDIFKRIFVNENLWIPIQISLKFVPRGSINNIPALVRIMAWRRPGDKPLSEPMMVNSPTYTYVTRPQWVK